MKILISAGEASGDLYASQLVHALRKRNRDVTFAGCAGPRMQAAGVEPVVDAANLNVVGLVEVIHHIPRIWGEYRKLVRWAHDQRPDAAILTDSPDFHLRLAARLKKLGIPVIYFVAPQAWAWRKGRLPKMRRDIRRLLCIFPFEEQFFRGHGLDAVYVGHPLTRLVRPSAPPPELRQRFGIAPGERVIALLPGSRPGEAVRHIPYLVEAALRLRHSHPDIRCLLALAPGFPTGTALRNFQERFSGASIKVIEAQTWDVLACADLALAASGTVTVEAALLGVPMVTFYRVTSLSWFLGKTLVRVPFYSMVNLIAGRRVIPEIIQGELTGSRLASEAAALLDNPAALAEMRSGLRQVSQKLSGSVDPMDAAADVVESYWKKEPVHVP